MKGVLRTNERTFVIVESLLRLKNFDICMIDDQSNTKMINFVTLRI